LDNSISSFCLTDKKPSDTHSGPFIVREGVSCDKNSSHGGEESKASDGEDHIGKASEKYE
jgi:hypothetical protein